MPLPHLLEPVVTDMIGDVLLQASRLQNLQQSIRDQRLNTVLMLQGGIVKVARVLDQRMADGDVFSSIMN
ncbi:hypothetical protein D3C81_2070500 [compost metagenome]